MQTIVLATQKGGSGKSTLAIGLALAAMQAGHTVRLIETDPQGTLSNWQSRRSYAEPVVEPIYSAGDIEHRLQALGSKRRDAAIIDTAGGVSAATTAAIRYADFCLIPARPSVADIEATASTLSVIKSLEQALRFRSQPDADPRPAHGKRGRRRSAMKPRSIPPMFWRNPSSSCATTTRMR